MVWARTTARRGWLCQADLGGKRRWTTEQRKTEKEMNRRRQAQHGGPAAQRGGCWESSWMEKKNPCGWPLTWGIHSLRERETIWCTEFLQPAAYYASVDRYLLKSAQTSSQEPNDNVTVWAWASSIPRLPLLNRSSIDISNLKQHSKLHRALWPHKPIGRRCRPGLSIQ